MKNIIRKFYPAAGGLILFFLLFLYGLAQNLSFSYMGNTSSQASKYIISNYLGFIILFLLKILLSYLAIGLLFGIIACIFWIAVSDLINKKFKFRLSLILNIGLSYIFFILFFYEDLILYPQTYMNNFYVRNNLNKLLVDFLSDYVNPNLFSAFKIIMAVAIFCVILHYIHKNYKKIFSYFIAVSAGLLVIAGVYALYEKKPVSSDKPNVLILASDALRRDHFGGYGYFRNTTPNIDGLIREGVSFNNTYIEIPRTFPSWVSIQTGQFASTHGIRHMFPTSRDVNRKLHTIAGVLNERGYETSVIGDYAADIFSRIDLGFKNVDAPYFNMTYMIQQVILEAHSGLFPFLTGKIGLSIFPVLQDSAYFCPPELVKNKIINSIRHSDKPFFITSFFSSTHFPYASPYPYYRIYADKNYSGPYKYYKQQIISLDKDANNKIPESDITQIHALYDGGLKAFDDSVGEVLNYLSENNILDKTVVILISDHGENLYEDDHGMGHGEHFRGSYASKIPFIIRYPELIKSRKDINDLVRNVDIAPTILSILNIPVPETMEGKSLLPLIKGEKMEKLCAYGETGIWFDNSQREDLFFQKLRIMYPDITYLSEIEKYFDDQIVLKYDYSDLINLAKHRYVFDGRYKLIYMPLKDKIVYELYDKQTDPLEKKNIAGTDGQNLSRMKKLLFEWVERNNDVIIRKDFIFPVLRY
jgi:arylsulfatase A-like enzyme